jgi:hypothetical protein
LLRPYGPPKPGAAHLPKQTRLRLSSSFVFLQSLSRSHLVSPAAGTSGADSSPGLHFPSALAGLGGPLAAGLPRPLRSALRVWLPSRRFSPPGSAPALFHADSAPGIPPSGACPSRKAPKTFPPRIDPPAVSTAGVLPRTNPRAGPAIRGSRALTVPGIPYPPDEVNAGHSRILPWASAFPGQPAGCLVRAPTRTPPTRFRTCGSADRKPLRPGVSSTPGWPGLLHLDQPSNKTKQPS